MRSLALVSVHLLASVTALNNGVGKLPKMGYDSKKYTPWLKICHSLINTVAWNAFQCDYDQDRVLAQAEAMVKHGLVEAGYNSLILDDCFTLRNRSASGKLVEG